MNYNDFINTITEIIQSKLGEDVTVSACPITKNNNVHLLGICFKTGEENAAPTIYMEYYYRLYLDGEDVVKLADDVISVYKSSRLENDFDIHFYTDYENVKNKIFCKVINFYNNKELLNDIPYKRLYDLAIVVYCTVDNPEIGKASILVRNEHIKLWKKNVNEIIDAAMINTRRKMNYNIVPMTKMLEELNEADSEENLIGNCDMGMYVVTNDEKYFGAVAIAQNELLTEFCDVCGDEYYIIPSSVHELILLKKNGGEDLNEINRMIREINMTAVGAEEVLSDHVYTYSKENGLSA